MMEVVVLLVLVLVLVLVDIKQEVENLGRSDMQRLLGSWLTIHCSAPSAVSILGLFSLWSCCKRVSANASQSFDGGKTHCCSAFQCQLNSVQVHGVLYHAFNPIIMIY